MKEKLIKHIDKLEAETVDAFGIFISSLKKALDLVKGLNSFEVNWEKPFEEIIDQIS